MDFAAHESRKAAKEYRDVLAFSRSALVGAVIAGSWVSGNFTPSPIIDIILTFAVIWATICHHALGFMFRKVVNPAIEGFVFLILLAVSPKWFLMLGGILLGTSIYLLMLLAILTSPRLKLIAGNRFYAFNHPLSRLMPLAYLAPKPLSRIFEPIVTFHWGVGTFNMPIWRVSVFDPPSLHDYIDTSVKVLGEDHDGWSETLIKFRQALGLLNLLETVCRFEKLDLDGVALAASARLALSEIPEATRNLLLEVLSTYKIDKQRSILSAFDISPSN